MLKLENVTKYYYSSASVQCALRKINLEFKLGEFVAITGESGSGKTTLLNILSGFDSYEEGEVYFNNQLTSYFDENDWEKYRKNEISFIFQNYNLIESYTVLQNVAMTYVLDGYSYKEAKQKAKEKLILVGLDKDWNKKTSKMSGGQKQRLAIARALAKETNIIIADEPTGNLDEKNGQNVLEILKSVSKDKLVIVVTHNIGQIEPYITRKVRLHDGEVVVDEVVEEVIEKRVEVVKREDKKDFKKALNFSFLNLISQPVKTSLIFLLALLCTISSFVFYANFKANLDENKVKLIDKSIFQNSDDTRLLVKKQDFSIISEDILKEAWVDKVISVEKYDYITDVNYYRPSDYKYVIDSELEDPTREDVIDYSYYSLVDNTHFMRSSSSLTEDMLKSGRLPQNDFEMVVYSNDDSILNTSEKILFHNEKTMGVNVAYRYDVKIVGILKERTNQVYFSNYLCQIMDSTFYDFLITLYFDEGNGKIRSIKTSKIVIDPSLTGNQMSLGKDMQDYLKFQKRTGYNFYLSHENEYLYLDLDYSRDYIMSISSSAIGVSKEVFDLIYGFIDEKSQFVVFIDDYANTDKVIDNLNEKGLEAISCFRSSTTGYDLEKLVNRYVNLIVSFVALFVINMVTIVLIYTIMKLKRNDYLIFKFNGLTNKLCQRINYLDVIIYGIVANIILIILANIIYTLTQNFLIIEIFKRINFLDYIVIFIITMISMCLIAKKFTNYLNKFNKISTMRED